MHATIMAMTWRHTLSGQVLVYSWDIQKLAYLPIDRLEADVERVAAGDCNEIRGEVCAIAVVGNHRIHRHAIIALGVNVFRNERDKEPIWASKVIVHCKIH